MVDIKSGNVLPSFLDLAVYLKGILLKWSFAKSKKDALLSVRSMIIKFMCKLMPAQKKLLEVIRLQELTDMYYSKQNERYHHQ
jgi:hypothetical protein